ncbi:hypothetical protein Fot_29975 [Forsythia ovata]|uniref:Uncharacterized protein n=1 Tax=Forsythia ovata TaxID=205694 RepID=A0ABD1TTF7_9LAMI
MSPLNPKIGEHALSLPKLSDWSNYSLNFPIHHSQPQLYTEFLSPPLSAASCTPMAASKAELHHFSPPLARKEAAVLKTQTPPPLRSGKGNDQKKSEANEKLVQKTEWRN